MVDKVEVDLNLIKVTLEVCLNIVSLFSINKLGRPLIANR